jgi:murein DD-endopeptidase MepM/ murein hydrolase activator NlpD
MSILRRLTVALLAALLPATAWSTPASARPGDPVPVGAWPLQPAPQVVTGFDPPDTPWGAGHRGVDLLGDPDQPVHAALAGTVTFAGVLAGRGVVVVLHGDTRTTYEPVEATVPVGGRVGRGEVIGRLQASGSHCPPQACLHWGWLRGSTYLDPLDLVGAAGPVRLLPLWRDEPLPVTGPMPMSTSNVAWTTPYTAVLLRLEALVARSPPGYARGCACW